MKGNCLNCHSENINLQSFDFQLNAPKNIVSEAFKNLLLLQKINSSDIRRLRLCRLCAEPLSLYIQSKQKFLKLTKSNSKISSLFTIGSSVPRKIQRQQILSDSREIIVTNRTSGGQNIIRENNAKAIVDYKELFIKLSVEKLPDCTAPLFPTKTSRKGSHLYKCSKCTRRFSDSQKLLNHHSCAHSPIQRELKCKFCNAKFAMVWFLKNHLYVCHKQTNSLYICKICQHCFYSKKDLEKHNLKHHDKKSLPYNCQHCMDSFKTVKGLRNHLIKSHEGTREANAAENNIKTAMERKLKTSKCLFCEKTFEDFHIRRKHINSKHADEAKRCDLCEKEFKCYNELLQHQKKHTKCPICKRKFGVYHHMRFHHDRVHFAPVSRPYQCEMCGQKYSDDFGLNSHYVWHAEVNGPDHCCNVCNKTFKLRGHLSQHLKQFHSVNYKTHKCPYCIQVFRVKGNLNFHISVRHKPKLKYPCKICGKKFLNSSGASTHSRIHTLHTKYSCDNSEKLKGSKVRNGKLEVMSCYSSKTYLFTCPICKASCDSQTHFFRHLRTIHDLKGYADPKVKVSSVLTCPICDKKFTRKDLLDKHTRRSHKIARKPQYVDNVVPRSYKCMYCRKTFTDYTFQVFSAHIKLHEIYIAEDVINTPTIITELVKFYNEKKKMFSCHLCKLKFGARREFLGHLKSKSHSNVKIIYNYENKCK